MYRILKNAIRCNYCGEIIVSTRRHEFVRCKCGCCHVGGGSECLRRGYRYSPYDYMELSEFEPMSVDR